MKSEAEVWIEKLEAALERREKLPPMRFAERMRIEWLVRQAGRHDLMICHLIPPDMSRARRMPLREYLREREALSQLHTRRG